MTSEQIAPAAGPLRGTVRVPGDKSISHRALLFAALAEGTSRVRGLSDGDDVVRTAAALRALGIEIDDGAIAGGRDHLREATAVVDLGNSGTAMRLLCGVAASLPFVTVLVGDDSLHRRPMGRIVGPLTEMGAVILGREHDTLAPLAVRGGGLSGIDYTPPVASAQVKAAVLLAGLGAGETVVREQIPTRRHTEEFLERCGADFDLDEREGAYAVHVRASALKPFSLDVPGDPSQAAFFCVAASIVEGSDVVVENVYVGPGRAGFLEALARMGADLEVEMTSATTADLHARHAALHGAEIAGALVPDLIDEIPVLAVAAAFAEGTTRFGDAAELRVKESDRIETMAAGLRALGAVVATRPDGLEVAGGRLSGGRVDAALDHRVAMSFAIGALASERGVEVAGFETVASSWPSFLADLAGLR